MKIWCITMLLLRLTFRKFLRGVNSKYVDDYFDFILTFYFAAVYLAATFFKVYFSINGGYFLMENYYEIEPKVVVTFTNQSSYPYPNELLGIIPESIFCYSQRFHKNIRK